MKEDSATTESMTGAWKEFLSKIRELCLNRNFGTLSKSEFDLLVFHYYLLDKQTQVDKKAQVDKQEPAGEKYVTDYEIGRDLGLTIQRVRSLRERDALKFETHSDDWKEKFIDCLKFAHCDSDSGFVKIPIPDVNVMKEVRNYLETLGLYDEFHLNPKVFQCQLDVLVAIFLNLRNKLDAEMCRRVLEELRACKDGKVSQVVNQQEHPVLAGLKEATIKQIKKTLDSIPVVGCACVELFESVYKNYANI